MIGVMDQSYYINIAIAVLPFIFWTAILFALYSPIGVLSEQTPPISDNTDTVDDTYKDNFVIIPYGLIFPIHYRSNSGVQNYG